MQARRAGVDGESKASRPARAKVVPSAVHDVSSTSEDVAERYELLEAPAFVVDSVGAIRLMNDAAARLLERDGERTRTRIEQLVGDRSAERPLDLDYVTEVVSANEEKSLLVVLVNRHRVGFFELRAAAERWCLTAREAEVVALVAEGLANKSIAQRLGAAPRTIEVHMTSILRKARAESRAKLVALFWTGK